MDLKRYRHDKATNRGYATFRNQRHDFDGEYNSPESLACYQRFLDFLGYRQAIIKQLDERQFSEMINLGELIQRYYNDRSAAGCSQAFLHHISALRRTIQQWHDVPANAYTVELAKRYRDHLTAGGLPLGNGKTSTPYCPRHANWVIGKLIGVFRFGVEEGIVAPAIYQALQCLRPLLDTNHLNPPPIKPVPWAHVEATRPFLPRMAWDMVQLQYLCCMRPGEVVRIRLAELDTSQMSNNGVWVYLPDKHKTAYRGKIRFIPIGPRGQQIIKPYIDHAQQLATELRGDYLFTHRAAFDLWRHSEPHYHFSYRRTRTEQARRYANRTARPVSENNYYCCRIRVALQRGNNAGLNIPTWFPNQLRHARATEVEHKYGPRGFQAISGDCMKMASVYVDQNFQLAMDIAREAG